MMVNWSWIKDEPDPMMSLRMSSHTISFTLGCGFIVGSFFALRGPKNQFAHMISKERLPFTLGFIGSMMGTLYVSMGLHSYILSVIFSVVQVLALVYYGVSYFPGGSTGLKFRLLIQTLGWCGSSSLSWFRKRRCSYYLAEPQLPQWRQKRM